MSFYREKNVVTSNQLENDEKEEKKKARIKMAFSLFQSKVNNLVKKFLNKRNSSNICLST